ncbi:MAG: 4Fe-4S binding protein [Planctomycetota bacterium]
MQANYGYKDGAGEFFITIDTEKCDGCGDCVPACPQHVLVMIENEFDLDAEKELAAVSALHTKKIKYSCGPCKPAAGYAIEDLPCVRACAAGAITHSW